MKIMLVLFSLIFSYYCEYAQHNYRSLFDEKENTDLLNEVWEFGFNNPEEKEYLSDLFKEINSNTVVVKFYLCGLKDYEMLSAENDPGSNLKIVQDYILLVNKSEDTVDAFGIYYEFDNAPALSYNDLEYNDREYDESMYWILNFVETTDWDKEQIFIFTIVDVPGFFVLYKEKVYIPYRNRMVAYETYFYHVESFYHRFSLLLDRKKFYQRMEYGR